MADLGELRAKITADIAELERALNAAGKGVKGFGDEGQKGSRRAAQGMRQAETAAKSLSNVTRGLARVLGPLGIGVSAAAAVKGIFDMSRAASDAEENLSKFNAVFRDNASTVQEWATTYSRSIGRATDDTIKYLSSVQDTLVPLGFMRGEASDLSKEIVTLANDIGSFNNQPTEQVMSAITSALTGQTRSMMQYGVVIRQTDVEQQALNMGIWDGVGALNAQQRAAATMELIMKGTADAQGDAERTADSFANTQRRLQSATRDLQAVLGQNVNEGLRPFYGWLGDIIQRTADAAREMNIFRRLMERRAAGEDLAAAEELQLVTMEVDRLKAALEALPEVDPNTGRATRQLNAAERALGGYVGIQEAAVATTNQRVHIEEELNKMLERQADLQREAEEIENARLERIRKEEEAQRAAMRAEEERLEAQRLAEEAANRLQDAYNRTEEGRLAALDAEIAYFKEQQAQATENLHMYPQIIEMLQKMRDEMTKAPERDFASDLDNLRESLMTEEEVLREALNQRLLLLQEAYAAEEITAEESRALGLELEQRYWDQIQEIQRRAMTDIQRFQAMSWSRQSSIVLGELAGLTNGLDRENRAQFEIMKAGAIAQAAVNTYTGITRSLSAYPMPLAGIMAAAHAAAGFAQVNNIRQQQFGSGATGSAPTPSAPAAMQSQEGRRAQQAVVINLQGDTFGRSDVASLITEINDAVSDGARIRLA